MVKLNLPPFDCNIRKKDGKAEIFDVVRKKYIVLTPEEWVRQHVIHYLHNYLNYPFTLMQVERGLNYNRRKKRSDILVFNSAGKPAVLVECKSYKDAELGEHVLQQAAAYNKTLGANFIVITNGWGYYCWKLENDEVKAVKEIPDWSEI
jgi:hypothetical protein